MLQRLVSCLSFIQTNHALLITSSLFFTLLLNIYLPSIESRRFNKYFISDNSSSTMPFSYLPERFLSYFILLSWSFQTNNLTLGFFTRSHARNPPAPPSYIRGTTSHTHLIDSSMFRSPQTKVLELTQSPNKCDTIPPPSHLLP